MKDGGKGPACTSCHMQLDASPADHFAQEVRNHFAVDVCEILSFFFPISMAWRSQNCTAPAQCRMRTALDHSGLLMEMGF